MDIQEALDKTLKDYGIKARHLATVSGVTERQISLFRNKNADIFAVKGLQELLEAMDAIAPGSRQHFCLLLAGKSSEQPDPNQLVSSMDNKELASLLSAIACRFAQSQPRLETERVAV